MAPEERVDAERPSRARARRGAPRSRSTSCSRRRRRPRPGAFLAGDDDAGAVRLGAAELRRRAAAGRADRPGARRRGPRPDDDGKPRAAGRAVLRAGVQGAGRHGRRAPRPDGVRAGLLGPFERGMVVTHAPTGRPFATKYAQSVFGRDRTTIEEAYPGDIVGLVNASALRRRRHALRRRAGRRSRRSRASPPSTSPSPACQDTGRFKQFRARHRPARRRRASCRCCARTCAATRPRCSPPSARCSSRWPRTGWSSEFGAPVRLEHLDYTRGPRAPTPAAAELPACAASRCSRAPTATLLALFTDKWRLNGGRARASRS